MDMLRSVYRIGCIYSFTDFESGITLKVMSQGDDYVITGGATGEYKLPKSKTSFIRLKAHWENYVKTNVPNTSVTNI